MTLQIILHRRPDAGQLGGNPPPLPPWYLGGPGYLGPPKRCKPGQVWIPPGKGKCVPGPTTSSGAVPSSAAYPYNPAGVAPPHPSSVTNYPYNPADANPPSPYIGPPIVVPTKKASGQLGRMVPLGRDPAYLGPPIVTACRCPAGWTSVHDVNGNCTGCIDPSAAQPTVTPPTVTTQTLPPATTTTPATTAPPAAATPAADDDEWDSIFGIPVQWLVIGGLAVGGLYLFSQSDTGEKKTARRLSIPI